MNTLKIFLAVIVIMLASNFLSACAPSELSQAEMARLSMARIELARENQKSLTVSLEEVQNDEQVVLDLVLNNPKNKPLTSAEMWLAYHPEHVKGVNFEPNEKAFELAAPYENGFDQEAGLFKFGRSTSRPIADSKITLARLTFESLSDQAVFLEAYDYAYGLQGHSSANVMVGGEPYNLLLQPVTPLFAQSASAQ